MALGRDVKLWVIGLGLALSGCASTVQPVSEAAMVADARQQEARGLLSPKCAEPKERPASDRHQVFVDTLILDVPRALADAASLQNLVQLAAAPEVEAWAAPHWIGERDGTLSVKMDLLDVQGRTERASLHRLRLGARDAEPQRTVLDVEVTLQLPNPSGRLPSPTHTVSLSLSAEEDAPALGRVAWSPQRSLVVVVRPRAVRSDRDLRAIFECKMQLHAAQSRRPR